MLDKAFLLEYISIKEGINQVKTVSDVERTIQAGEGFLVKKRLNKTTLSIDKEWRGFFVPIRKG